jgi:putative transcriptional regulator
MMRSAINCTAMSKDGSMSSSSPAEARRTASSRLAKRTNGNVLTRVRLEPDGSMVEIMSDGRTRPIRPRTDWSVVDATTEADIARHAKEDSDEAAHDAAAWAREVRRRVGLSQTDFSRCIGVPLAKVRGWESGKQTPAGPERTLLRLIAYSPKTALAALAR